MNPDNDGHAWLSSHCGKCVSSWSSWWSRGLDLCLLLQRQLVLLHLLPHCEVSYCFREPLTPAQRRSSPSGAETREMLSFDLRQPEKNTSADCGRRARRSLQAGLALKERLPVSPRLRLHSSDLLVSLEGSSGQEKQTTMPTPESVCVAVQVCEW